jgi:hypothetical protein
VKKKKISTAYFPIELPGESLYEKESREAEAMLAKQRTAHKVSAKPKKSTKP